MDSENEVKVYNKQKDSNPIAVVMLAIIIIALIVCASCHKYLHNYMEKANTTQEVTINI